MMYLMYVTHMLYLIKSQWVDVSLATSHGFTHCHAHFVPVQNICRCVMSSEILNIDLRKHLFWYLMLISQMSADLHGNWPRVLL